MKQKINLQLIKILFFGAIILLDSIAIFAQSPDWRCLKNKDGIFSKKEYKNLAKPGSIHSADKFFYNDKDNFGKVNLPNPFPFINTQSFQQKFHDERLSSQSLPSNSLVPIYDSVYFWSWDTLSAEWNISAYGRVINIVYDSSNRLESYIEQFKNGGIWQDSLKSSYTYDFNNNVAGNLLQTWNGSAWIDRWQYTWTYDIHNNITSETVQTVGGGINDYKMIYTYDVNNNKTSQLGQSWSSGYWYDVWQVLYTYDTNNNLLVELFQTSVSGTWENDHQYIYTYDINNNMVNALWQNSFGNPWVNIQQKSLTYDMNNNCTSGLYQNWDSSAWVNNWQFFATYDVNNNEINELQQIWNNTAWEDLFQFNLTYDNNNNITSYLRQTVSGSTWLNEFQYVFAYDSGNNLISKLYQIWYTNTWVNVTEENHTFDAANFQFSYTYKNWDLTGTVVTFGDSIYYYFHTPTGINNLTSEKGDITIFPNPVKKNATLKFNLQRKGKVTIMLTDIRGKEITDLISEKEMNEGNHDFNFDLSNLKSGIYLLRLKSENRDANLKLIKVD